MKDTYKRPTPEDIARVKWNRTADDYNQWDTLDIEEKRELIAMEATSPAERPTPITDAKAEMRIVKGRPKEIVEADKMRDLERQLAEAREIIDAAKRPVDQAVIMRLIEERNEAREQRDALLTALRTWQRIANAGANHEGIAKARQQTNVALAAVERSDNEPR